MMVMGTIEPAMKMDDDDDDADGANNDDDN